MKIPTGSVHGSYYLSTSSKTILNVMTDFISRVPKSLQMVMEDMKLKDTCSLEGKL